jgi:hypothetical protein
MYPVARSAACRAARYCCRAPLLDDQGMNIALSPTLSFSGARQVAIEAYAVWSTADQGPNPNQHFDSIVDPAGWYNSAGNLLNGSFKNTAGVVVATWSGATLTNNDGSTHNVAWYLANDFFEPLAANTDHQSFYGYLNGDESAGVPGTLMGFVQSPGFQPPANSAGIANLQMTPGIELDNPVSAGVNNGDIKILSNWNLGAEDGGGNLLYRYRGNGNGNPVAPRITFRAGGSIAINASITDGFQQTVGLAPGTPAPPPVGPYPFLTYTSVLADYTVLSSASGYNLAFFDFGDLQVDTSSSSPLALKPPATFGALGLSGSAVIDAYYGAYEAYLAEYGIFYLNYLGGLSGFYQSTGGTQTPDVTAAYAVAQAAYSPTNLSAYSNYVNTYDVYLQTWLNWAFAEFGNGVFTFATLPVALTPPPVVSFAPPPVPPPPFIPPQNSPSPVAAATNLAPIAGMNLAAEASSASYRFVAGADTQSADPLALSFAAAFAGAGNVSIDGHTAFAFLANKEPVIVVPTIVRTGTGSIDIAAAGDFALLDPLAPGVVYTAGTPVQPAIGGDSVGVAMGSGAFAVLNGLVTPGVSTLLSSAVNPANAGNITITALGNIIGIQNVKDTLADSTTVPTGISGGAGTFIGQFWSSWLLSNPANPDVAWYVNFGSFDQGVMSIGGNVTISAGGDIHDLAVSLPTTAWLDSNHATHITGGGNLSVTAGGSIYSGDFYVGKGAGVIKAGGAIASDFTYGALAAPVQTLLAVQYGTIDVEARQSADIGGVYDPTYLWAPDMFPFARSNAPVASYASVGAKPVVLTPYVTSMDADSGVSIRSTGGSVAFNSLTVQAGLFGLGQYQAFTGLHDIADSAAGISSLLLPASLNLVALSGDITISHGGGLYPSATGTLSIVADQSIHLAIPTQFGRDTNNQPVTGTDPFSTVGNVFGNALGKLDYPVGTGILPTASNPELVDVSQLPAALTHDAALVQDNPATSAPVRIVALNGSIVDGVPALTSSLMLGVGGATGQISLISNAPTLIYAGMDILNLPFFGENFSTTDITSITAGRDISASIFGTAQPAAIELAGPGTLNVRAGRDIDFQSQRLVAKSQSGIRTLGNSIDNAANPYNIQQSTILANASTSLLNFGNPYLPQGGASANVLFGVSAGIDSAAFINQYINPANAAVTAPASLAALVAFVDQYQIASSNANASLLQSADQAWVLFQALPAAQQQRLVSQVFSGILDTTGKDYNDAGSPFFHQYGRGYQAINTLFPAALGYTDNQSGGSNGNGAGQTVKRGDLDMRGSTIQTQQGGDISIFGPGGRILVGSSVASPATNPASEGILTLEQGSINIFTDQDVLVAQSRVMTEQGGNILMWSSNGNLDAGKGAKTSVSAPPPKYTCDIDFVCSADIKGFVSGAGIATLQSLPDVPVGDANLIAPRGTVDAGAAGIRVSGNINIAALQVANAANIDVQGKAVGIPGLVQVNVGALANAGAAATQAAMAAQDVVQRDRSAARQALPSIFTVRVLGFGNDAVDGAGQPAASSGLQGGTGYDAKNRVQVIGHGGNIKPEVLSRLSDDERRRLMQDR